MSELEVGQVWEESRGVYTILDLVIYKGEVRVIFKRTINMEFASAGSCGEGEFRRDTKLIQNADGTPVKKPKKYKELTPVEAMRLLADAGQPIECQASDFDERWSDIILTGSDLDDDASWPFTSVCGSFKQCRIEVTND